MRLCDVVDEIRDYDDVDVDDDDERFVTLYWSLVAKKLEPFRMLGIFQVTFDV